MAEPVTIAVDVMGGDRGPAVVLRGALQALEADPDLRLTLVGPAEEVEPFAAVHDRATAQVATEVIEMGEHPAGAVRAKKDSSIVVGCRLVKEGAADGFFSAGSTGACLAAATLVVGRIKGVKRPALGQVIPAWARPTLLIDVGANADCKPEYLVQFAQMGEVYMNAIMGVERPKVGLLNIGEEDTKGDLFAQEAHRLLSETVPAFAGNCEGGDLMAGDFDVVVTENMFGDILSDEASMVTGSIGLLPSASIGDAAPGLYEPIHGSAPDIAGQDKANPIATILSVAMMFRYSFHLAAEAQAIENAVDAVLAEGWRTADIAEPGVIPIGTREMGRRIREKL